MKTQHNTATPTAGQIIQIEGARGRDHLVEIVRGSVAETLNAMLQNEADELCQAWRRERKAEGVSARAGTCERKPEAKAGVVTLRIPNLRSVPFETAIVRALSTERIVRRGGVARDLPRRCLHSPNRSRARSCTAALATGGMWCPKR